MKLKLLPSNDRIRIETLIRLLQEQPGNYFVQPLMRGGEMDLVVVDGNDNVYGYIYLREEEYIKTNL